MVWKTSLWQAEQPIILKEGKRKLAPEVIAVWANENMGTSKTVGQNPPGIGSAWKYFPAPHARDIGGDVRIADPQVDVFDFRMDGHTEKFARARQPTWPNVNIVTLAVTDTFRNNVHR